MAGQAGTGEAPDAAAIERIARAAMARLPAIFRRHLDDVLLLVEEWADDETLAALRLEHPLDLTGLYHGVPLGEKEGVTAALPDRIHLYRRAILDEWIDTGVRLNDLVAHVLVHEVGHHFGLSDADMAALEAGEG